MLHMTRLSESRTPPQGPRKREISQYWLLLGKPKEHNNLNIEICYESSLSKGSQAILKTTNTRSDQG